MLTPKQERFVAEYLVDLNASAAARRSGYSARTADAIGRENLGKPTIAAAIQAAQAERAERVDLTQDDVVRDIVRIRRKAETAGEFAPALRATELLGKHLGMFRTQVDLGLSAGVADLIAAARKRAKG